MRTIKFRVFKKETGIMYYPEATQEQFNHYLQIGSGGFWLYDREGKLLCTSNWDDALMQYTGLKDKNGKEIYEGDLIRFAEKYLYLVKYEDAKFVGYHANNDWGKWGDIYKLGEAGFSKYNYVIVGNIYDNPELLTPAGGQSSVNNMLHDPNVKTEEEVKEPAEQAPAPEAQPGSAEGETGE